VFGGTLNLVQPNPIRPQCPIVPMQRSVEGASMSSPAGQLRAS